MHGPTAAVFIGRFQPYHLAHREILHDALRKYDDVVMVIGSSGRFRERTHRNPWTSYEREEMIRNDILPLGSRLHFHHQPDCPDADLLWARQVKLGVATQLDDFRGTRSISIVGSMKDASSYYLELFPSWTPDLRYASGMNATDIRHRYFNFWDGTPDAPHWAAHLPFGSTRLLLEFIGSPDFNKIKKEMTHVNK